MGTNYDLVGPSHPPLHIGNASAGWRFLFRGYREAELAPTGLCEWVSIDCAEDWRAVLAASVAAGDHIQDEYNFSLSVDEFWELVVAHTDGHRATGNRFHSVFYDEEGHPFSFEDFS